MNTIVLSDHTGDQIQQRERGRQQKHDDEMAKYNDEVASRDRWIEAEYESQKSAYEKELEIWQGKSWPQRLLYGFSKSVAMFLLCLIAIGASVVMYVMNPAAWGVLLLIPGTFAFMALFFPAREPRQPSREKIDRGRSKPLQPIRQRAGEEDRVWQAGSEGESKVTAYLSSRLGDDWTLLSGYRGTGGEIDQILVGPKGACALETKFINGKVIVLGDDWTLTKYDKYGNVVERGKQVQDRAGRSPSAQINGSVKPLESFLSKRKIIPRVGRAVILAHDRSDIQLVKDQSVDEITTLRQLNIEKLFTGTDPLSAEVAASVVQHIQRDHEFHKKRSQRPRRRNSRRTRAAT